MKPIKVLSLFDGVSCGMVALERAGIPVERYVAYEIDKYAIQVSEKNYPQIEHCGDVTTADFTQYKGFDLLIGGSPCTYWSIAKKDRETTSSGIGWELFMQYIRALKESGCKHFLYENNFSIHKDIKREITKELGVEPIMINSALVSAQQRKRCYWTNIPNVAQPEDKGILLKDILESGTAWNEKSYAYTTRCQGAIIEDTLKRHRHTMVAEPIIKPQRLFNVNPSGNGINGNVYSVEGKSPCVTTNKGEGQKIFEPMGAAYRSRDNSLQLELNNQSKSNALTQNYDHSLVCEPVRIGQIGKGGQGQRIYSVRGKSVTIQSNSGGLGSNTGLYKIDLPDGDYIIRKLTPIEAERLQTLPDNYTNCVSNTQRYKGIGNGWTVDVISHILGGLKL